ncbi:MAG: hypothetical protein MHM6MM_001021 [Cercozoa sp. M6MM]
MTLHGVTNCPEDKDISVDVLRQVTPTLLKRFGIDMEDFQIKVVKRSCNNKGGGQVDVRLPALRQSLSPIDLCDFGKVKRIRGTVFTARVAPVTASRVATAARGIFNRLLPDVWLYTEHAKGAGAASAGYGAYAVAETTTGVSVSTECFGASRCLANGLKIENAEDMGRALAHMLLQEVSHAPCVDGAHQTLVLTLMALGPEDVSKVRTGPLTKNAIKVLRLLREVLDVTFRATEEKNGVVLSCLGAGFVNMHHAES